MTKQLKISDLHASISPLQVTGVTSDSREVKPGMIFVAVRGVTHDGHDHLLEAQTKGAILAVVERKPTLPLTIPTFTVHNSALVLSQLAADYYKNPSQSLLVIGVTGTSGKTTTTYLIESILKAVGHHVGVIGTVNIRHGDKIVPSSLTTPGAVEIQRILHEMKAAGCTAVVMEVSSHALKQKRVASIAFDGMVFSNLSPEHLDYHPDMEDYFQSKSILFKELAQESIAMGKRPVAAINSADLYGQRLFTELQQHARPELKIVEFRADSDLTCQIDGISGDFQGVSIRSSLVGQFNAANIAAAAALALGLGISPTCITDGIATLKGVPGRLERVPNTHGIHVWVDYAHKPDALEKVLATLTLIQGANRLITVFGCGGDRDRKKRPLMGEIAVRCSNAVWVTSDNPRTESPEAIIQEILTGIRNAQNVKVQPDRAKAIQESIGFARRGDLILIAGKGHEDYQILGTRKIHFDDREIAFQALNEMK